MAKSAANRRCRNLVVVLGDQLNADSAAFDGFDPKQDAAWMAEVTEESTHVWTHKARIVIFLAGMRHFHDALVKREFIVHYRRLDDRGNKGTFAGELEAAVTKLKPTRLILVEPGEWRVRQSFLETAKNARIELEFRPDRHFLSSPQEFAEHAKGRKQLRLEYFYREMRRKHDVLMDGGEPEGGKWNYDSDNRGSFSKKGPARISAPKRFRPDATTKEVIALVERKFAAHPGKLDHFDWPVTSKQAKQALTDFVQHRLPSFGAYQDAMWTNEPYLYHSRISAALNLKLLNPFDVICQHAISVAVRLEFMKVLPASERTRKLRVAKSLTRLVTVMPGDPPQPERAESLSEFHEAAVANPIASSHNSNALPGRNQPVESSRALVPREGFFSGYGQM